jgi:hypothetical protein
LNTGIQSVGEHLGDLLVVDLRDDVRSPDFTFSHSPSQNRLLLRIAQVRRALEVLRVGRRLLVRRTLAIFIVELAESGGAVIRRMLRAPASSIRSSPCPAEPVGNVAIRQRGRSRRGLVGDGDGDAPRTDPLGRRISIVCDGGLAHLDGGWKRHPSSVLLDVLAVLVQRGGADGLRSPRASIGRDDAASIAPSAAPAPTKVCSSSMNG